MKRLLILLILLMATSSVFAKTVQCVRKYQVFAASGINAYTYDVTPAANSMLEQGWRIVSITPVTRRSGDANPTDYVIVLFERDE